MKAWRRGWRIKVFQLLPYVAVLIGTLSALVGLFSKLEGRPNFWVWSALILTVLSFVVAVALIWLEPKPNKELPLIADIKERGWEGSFPAPASITTTSNCPYVYSILTSPVDNIDADFSTHLDVMFESIFQWNNWYKREEGKFVPETKEEVLTQLGELPDFFEQKVKFELESKRRYFLNRMASDWKTNGRGISTEPLKDFEVGKAGERIFVELRFIDYVFGLSSKCRGVLTVSEAN